MDWSLNLQDVSDAQLKQALSVSNVPPLMASLMHLTNDTEHLRGKVIPSVLPLAEVEDGLSDEAREIARQLAFELLVRYRAAGCPTLPEPAEPLILEAMHYVTGEAFPQEQTELMREELNLFGEDRRRLEIPEGTVPEGYRVLVIGAGMSGVLAAIRLQQAGIDHLVVDKNPEIGGTWYENTYPGCQVDSANHLYNYIFEPNPQWPSYFSNRDSLFEYFHGIVDKYGIRDRARLATRVSKLIYDDDSHLWQAYFEDSNGKQTKERFNTVISACGQLNTPALPEIPGIDNFTGAAFHSARWNHQQEFSGKRVAVIGTGCSATQFVPEIADKTTQLTVFQRTPNWLLPIENYHYSMEQEELWCLRNIPFYDRWYRFYLFRSRGVDGLLPFFYSEEGWQGEPRSVGPANAEFRGALEDYIREQAGDDAALADALIPDFPPGGKRPILDDGSWVSTLKKENVSLVTEGIQEILPRGIRTCDGVVHDVDVIIYGTGFKADQFLSTLDVKGRSGRDLHDSWQGDPRAYKGITVPGFPNLYLLYGPNTNIVVGASIVFFSECEMRYIMGCLRMQFEQGLESLEVKQDVFSEYNAHIDELNTQRAWGSPHVSSWYKSTTGRVSQNWPGTHFEWWQQTREPDPRDFLKSISD